jgi:hypothetical protein
MMMFEGLKLTVAVRDGGWWAIESFNDHGNVPFIYHRSSPS